MLMQFRHIFYDQRLCRLSRTKFPELDNVDAELYGDLFNDVRLLMDICAHPVDTYPRFPVKVAADVVVPQWAFLNVSAVSGLLRLAVADTHVCHFTSPTTISIQFLQKKVSFTFIPYYI